jgi:hypothetical protein
MSKTFRTEHDQPIKLKFDVCHIPVLVMRYFIHLRPFKIMQKN